MFLPKVEIQVRSVMHEYFRAKGAHNSVFDNAVVGMFLDVGVHVDLVVILDMVPKFNQVIMIGEADITVVAT